MADVARSHGGDGGNEPPNQNSKRIRTGCESFSGVGMSTVPTHTESKSVLVPKMLVKVPVYEDQPPPFHPQAMHRGEPSTLDDNINNNDNNNDDGDHQSGGGIVVREHMLMFDKVLTPSDVGKLNRLVIPKHHAERHFPMVHSNNNKGFLLNFEDRNGKPWRFRYSFWNSSQSYVITKGWGSFVKEKKLHAGDIVFFQRGVGGSATGRLFINWRHQNFRVGERGISMPMSKASNYQQRTISSNFGHRLEKLIKLFETESEFNKPDSDEEEEEEEEEEADSVKMMKESLDGLMSYLREMMVGYENEVVLALLNEMEDLVASYVWPEDKMIIICEQLCNIRYNSNVEEEKAVVGFDDEIETLLDQLTATSTKQFQIISITGLAGLGKTTLARTLYNHDLVKYMFDFRAWTCVSQVYQQKDLLLGILSSFMDDLTDDFYEMSEHQLGEKLYRKLKGRKYLVVLDDIWDCRVWNDIQMYLPDDKTGSRVLFTSRDIDVSLQIKSARPAHVLRLRTEVESWAIFEKKVFRMGICPGGLEIYGRMINGKCEGFTLAIVIAAGLVKNNLSVTWWEQIANSLHSYMVSDSRQYIESLTLSYDHLPHQLRPCFLFLGAFHEEVPVTKLIWLWIAQGFIDDTRSRTLEDIAVDFLLDLIRRSLLMASRKKSDGQVKTCRIHDLLHDFCLRKAEEENFLLNNYRYGMLSSMLCFPLELGKSLQEGGSIQIDTYKFLKILDLESILISLFPLAVVHMVNLRYLAIQAHDGSLHASISNLMNLQMLIISSRKNIILPKTIWSMLNLRHLYIKSGINLMEEPSFLQVTEKDGPSALASLQTLSQVNPRSCHNVFSRTPNLRKLGFCGPLISMLGDLEFPDLGSLDHLQKLKLHNTFFYPEPTRSCNPYNFPEKIKRLTLLNTCMDWGEMWTFAWLPNLEVLKLKLNSCIGGRWKTGDAEFLKLKVLKLHDLDIKQWVCFRDNFPRLQRLVVHRCLKLDSVPAALGKILTLEVIEVNGCSLSAYRSAVEIQKEQESEGNSFLKVHGKENF